MTRVVHLRHEPYDIRIDRWTKWGKRVRSLERRPGDEHLGKAVPYEPAAHHRVDATFPFLRLGNMGLVQTPLGSPGPRSKAAQTTSGEAVRRSSRADLIEHAARLLLPPLTASQAVLSLEGLPRLALRGEPFVVAACVAF